MHPEGRCRDFFKVKLDDEPDTEDEVSAEEAREKRTWPNDSSDEDAIEEKKEPAEAVRTDPSESLYGVEPEEPAFAVEPREPAFAVELAPEDLEIELPKEEFAGMLEDEAAILGLTPEEQQEAWGIVDTGASSSMIQLGAAEKLYRLRPGDVSVDATKRSSFRFANGARGITSSSMMLEQVVDEEPVNLTLAVLETDGPSGEVALIGADWLEKHEAIINCKESYMMIKGHKVPLRRAKNGHLLLKLGNRRLDKPEMRGSSSSSQK